MKTIAFHARDQLAAVLTSRLVCVTLALSMVSAVVLEPAAIDRFKRRVTGQVDEGATMTGPLKTRIKLEGFSRQQQEIMETAIIAAAERVKKAFWALTMTEYADPIAESDYFRDEKGQPLVAAKGNLQGLPQGTLLLSPKLMFIQQHRADYAQLLGKMIRILASRQLRFEYVPCRNIGSRLKRVMTNGGTGTLGFTLEDRHGRPLSPIFVTDLAFGSNKGLDFQVDLVVHEWGRLFLDMKAVDDRKETPADVFKWDEVVGCLSERFDRVQQLAPGG